MDFAGLHPAALGDLRHRSRAALQGQQQDSDGLPRKDESPLFHEDMTTPDS
jgi:hypothetical protein